MTWQNMQLGSTGSQRPDVYALYKSYSKPNPTAYECKISVSDFRSDVTSAKWRGYLSFAWSVVFAVPAGLITKEQVPEMCGLIVRHENVWRLAKKATVCPRPIDQDCLLKLLIDGVAREGPAHRARKWHKDDVVREFAAKFGSEAARYVSDATETHRRIERAERQANLIVERAEKKARELACSWESAPPLWAELVSVLGLKGDVTRWQAEQSVRELKNKRAGSAEMQALKHVIRFMDRFVQEYREFAEDAKPEEAA